MAASNPSQLRRTVGARAERARVTIGLPFCGGEDYLRLAVRSVYAQTLSEWQLLLVDDGSSDGSLEFARAIRDPRVRVLSDGKNSGLAKRLNQIATLCETEFLCRMDADDVMHPSRLEAQLTHCLSNPTFDVIGAQTYSLDSQSVVRGVRTGSAGVITPASVMTRGLFAHPTVFARTEWFRKNAYDPRYRRAQDYELWTRTAAASRFEIVQEPLLYYREPATVRLDAYRESCKAVRALLRERGPSIIGAAAARRAVLKSHVKEIAYRLGAAMGCTEIFVARRSRALSSEQAHHANAGLAAVRAARIPGID